MTLHREWKARQVRDALTSEKFDTATRELHVCKIALRAYEQPACQTETDNSADRGRENRFPKSPGHPFAYGAQISPVQRHEHEDYAGERCERRFLRSKRASDEHRHPYRASDGHTVRQATRESVQG